MPVEGCDVSHHNLEVNWKAIAQTGVGFAYIKATDGASNTDNWFVRNWQGATSAGLLTGAYHFFRPLHDPVQQADAFLKAIGSRKGLPPVIDLEWSPRPKAKITDEWTLMKGGQPLVPLQKRLQIIVQFLQRVESQIGRKPIIYTATSWWVPTLNNAKTSQGVSFADYQLWIAYYPKKRPLTLPAPWKSYLFHQYSGTGNIAGEYPIDQNRYDGTIEELRGLSQ